MNPNDNSAHIYDLAFRSLKPDRITEDEIMLITTRLDKGAKVLDIGGGTGRHAKLLLHLGYKVTIIDSSKEMLKSFKEKLNEEELKNVEIINEDFYKANIQKHTYDMTILFWNSFNEIALNHKKALKLLKRSFRAMKEDGVVLINIDDSTKVDPAKFDFSTAYLKDGLEYKVHWETFEYSKKSNTSVSKETITIENKKGEKVEELTSFIKQKYWSFHEIKNICNELNLKIQNLKLKSSGELYLLISK